MNFQELKRKISIFNKMVNKTHENRTQNERLFVKSMKISEEVWEFHNEILWYTWYTRTGKKHSREEFSGVL